MRRPRVPWWLAAGFAAAGLAAAVAAGVERGPATTPRRAEQGAAQPPGADRAAAPPGFHQPSAAQPGVNQPSAAQPGAHQPSAAQPGTHQPGADQPAADQPAALSARTPASGAPATFLAMTRDFEGFTRWRRVAVEGAMRPEGVAPGPTFVYANRPAPPPGAPWPVGTVLVKVIEAGPRPADWAVHAMVKRGGGFNRAGAVGWEYFELALGDGARPLVRWRGVDPPQGHGYAAALRPSELPDGPLTCNDCHAGEGVDGVLTAALARR